jgi:hypothetical protein
MLLECAVSTPLSNRWATKSLICSGDRAASYNKVCQGWIPESLLEEHDNGLVVDLRNDIPLIAKALNELPKGLNLLLDDTN